MSLAGSAHPQISVAKHCLPSCTHRIRGCEPLSGSSKIHTIFQRVHSSKNMGPAQILGGGLKYFYAFLRLKQSKMRYCQHPMSQECLHRQGILEKSWFS